MRQLVHRSIRIRRSAPPCVHSRTLLDSCICQRHTLWLPARTDQFELRRAISLGTFGLAPSVTGVLHQAGAPCWPSARGQTDVPYWRARPSLSFPLRPQATYHGLACRVEGYFIRFTPTLYPQLVSSTRPGPQEPERLSLCH